MAKSKKTAEERLEELEKKVGELSARRTGGMLSSNDFLNLVILENVEGAKKDFWKRDFEKHGRKFIIDPFDPKHLTPFSYDLSVGEQVYSCSRRTVENMRDCKDETYWMAPRETIVIKTEEFIALPPYYSATVWPRFRMPIESIFQSMVKIDPTWYGELGVAIANLSGGSYPVRRGEPFATLVLYELETTTGMFLYRKENLPDAREVKLRERGGLNIDSIEKEIEAKGLGGVCAIIEDKVKLKECPDEVSLKKLLEVNKSETWRNAIIECIGCRAREMDGLGLSTLEMIRPTRAKVQKLTKEEIQKTECSETALENAAIEHGKPFNLLAAMPESILEKVEKEVVPRVEAEVGARLFPQIVQLTVRVLALLSLIGVLIAVAGRLLGEEGQVTWLAIGVLIAILVMFVILILALRSFPARNGKSGLKLKREVRSIREKIERLEKKNQEGS